MKISGYLRSDGSIGFRNHIAILTSVGCARDAVNWAPTMTRPFAPSQAWEKTPTSPVCWSSGWDAKQSLLNA